MARKAIADGITKMVATPHMMPDGGYKNRSPEVIKLVNEANAKFERVGIGLEVFAGGEIYLVPDVEKAIDNGDLLTYDNKRKYALFEWSTAQLPPYAENVFFNCQMRHITPIIAHVERYESVLERPELPVDWVRKGVLLQVNARSLESHAHRRSHRYDRVKRVAEMLIERRLIHFVATDAHSVNKRPPVLSRAYDRVADLTDTEYADVLFRVNPGRVLEGEEAIRWEPVPSRGRRRLLSRLFKIG